MYPPLLLPGPEISGGMRGVPLRLPQRGKRQEVGLQPHVSPRLPRQMADVAGGFGMAFLPSLPNPDGSAGAREREGDGRGGEWGRREMLALLAKFREEGSRPAATVIPRLTY
ncbi:unnamed protein product [Linum trigynum]|uniref:Uncharacterized protein n=1 Tax=Linum trigynum TaxID=586398 RepID=A0AAV2E379_9ROSI